MFSLFLNFKILILIHIYIIKKIYLKIFLHQVRKL